MGFLRGSQTDISSPLEPGEAYDWLIYCSLFLCSEWAFYACFEGFFLRALGTVRVYLCGTAGRVDPALLVK